MAGLFILLGKTLVSCVPGLFILPGKAFVSCVAGLLSVKCCVNVSFSTVRTHQSVQRRLNHTNILACNFKLTLPRVSLDNRGVEPHNYLNDKYTTYLHDQPSPAPTQLVLMGKALVIC